MTRRWILAIALVLATLGLGLLLQRLWLEPQIAGLPTVDRYGAPVSPAASNEPRAAGDEPRSTPDLAPGKPLSARVKSVEGSAEVYDAKPGRWRRLAPGDMVSDDAVVRTQGGGVELEIGESIEVDVGPYSQFRLKELTSRLSKVRLEQGLVTASVDSNDDAELVLQVHGSEAEARSKDGAFSVLRGHEGHATVAGSRGTVTVQSAGTSVVLQQGQQSTVSPGEAPTTPTAIPGELLIKLTQGQNKKLRFRSTRVEGTTNPGAFVTVNGQETAALDGHFSLNVPLNEGRNSITVISRDVLGREEKQTILGVEVDTRPPTAKGRVQW